MIGLITRTAIAFIVLGAPTFALGADPTATAIRIGDHPGFVRVVIDRTATPAQEEFAGADPEIADGSVTVDIPRTQIGSLQTVTSNGVTVTPTTVGSTLRLRITASARAFKYYGDQTLTGRLIIDLWKSRPAFPGATRRDAGCIAIGARTAGAGRITVRGIGRGIFENSFLLAVRNSRGLIVAKRAVTATGFPNSTWSATLRYRVNAVQTGTLEAVDLGGRVGHLCLAQVPIALRPAP